MTGKGSTRGDLQTERHHRHCLLFKREVFTPEPLLFFNGKYTQVHSY